MTSCFPAVRQAGICLHITALPGDFGCGELGAAAHDFIDQLAEMGMRVWQFLPTGPTGFGDSPYQSLSAFAGNELLIDLADLVRQGLLEEQELQPLRQLPRSHVDFSALLPLKTELLDLAAQRFAGAPALAESADYRSFLETHGPIWLTDYALFRALKRQHHERPWTEWAEEYRSRSSQAVADFAVQAAAELARIQIQQFFFYQQWQRLRGHADKKGILLLGDTPIYLALDSADVWAEPRLVRLDAEGNPIESGGVPPDSFSDDGQLWGNPLYDWDYHLKTDFAWWVQRLKSTFELTHLVRIDHFRGLEAYWAVPFGAETARSGCWRKCPGHELLSTLFRDLPNPSLIAEDLGFMTDAVRALRDDFGIPGMVFLQELFREDSFDPDSISPASVCYPATHDSDTVLGWFQGNESLQSPEELAAMQKAALAATGGSPENIAEDFVHLALASRSNLVIVQMQDLLGLGSEARFNRPGTLGGNWQWRLVQLEKRIISHVKQLLEASQRQGQA